MRAAELSISGCWEITPDLHADARGTFLEWFRPDLLADVVGHGMTVAQANLSVSAKGVVRGIHFSQVPPRHEPVGERHGPGRMPVLRPTAAGSVMSRSERVAAVTSCPLSRRASTTSRPSMPAAPVTSRRSVTSVPRSP